ncbi:peptidoglycan D,D-transpeptidase FtsI family protein [Patescibacteria group bacterium]
MKKTYLLFVVFFIAFAALLVRLFYWQVVKGSDLSRQAKLQYNSGQVLSAPRGNISASDGSYLAVGTDSWLVYATPPEITETSKKIANILSPFFVSDAEGKQSLLDETNRLQALLEKSGVVWTPLKQKVTPEVKKNIEALNINGIGFERQEIRFYPEASSAAQLLGFVGKNEAGEDVGYFGLEGYYDLSLSGKFGYVGREKGGGGAPILLGGSHQASAIDGVDLVTSIDKRIQLMVEKKLSEGLKRYEAKAGSVIVMNPFTGNIFAMASEPSYDPASYWDYGDEYFKNPVASDSFEPGSVFKVIIMASALDAGVVEPDTKCDICTGPLRVDKYDIDTWDGKYYPDSTMTEVIVHSDNVGMASVGQKMGVENMYDYLDKFGIGKSTGIDLQGEAAVPLRKKGTWNIVDLATASFGQGVSVTSIQMARAVSVIANGGELITPNVVQKLKSDGWEEEIKSNKGVRIISEKAAEEMTAMMVEAAKHGEAKWTDVPGFGVAGKTGTAQIPIAGHYDADKTIASFVGFAPSDKPKFLMFVTLREPQSSQWASETAAPLWYSIAKDLFPYFGIHPEN